jgi:hypothetical protein
MRTIQPEPFNVYTIDELTDEKAKKRAIEFCKEDATSDELLFEMVTDEAEEQLTSMGFYEPKIYYSCSYSQGDGACFVANTMFHFDKFLPAIKKFFNKEDWKALQKIQKSGMELELSLSHRGMYYHEKSVTVSLTLHDHGIDGYVVKKVGGVFVETHITHYVAEIETVIQNWYEAFCQNLYKKLCAEIEYFWKDENCIQHAKDCEFEFTESGKLYQD